MLVLDANILIRAVLGSRVLSLLRKYAENVEFLAPGTAFAEAREELPAILERRKVPVASCDGNLGSTGWAGANRRGRDLSKLRVHCPAANCSA